MAAGSSLDLSAGLATTHVTDEAGSRDPAVRASASRSVKQLGLALHPQARAALLARRFDAPEVAALAAWCREAAANLDLVLVQPDDPPPEHVPDIKPPAAVKRAPAAIETATCPACKAPDAPTTVTGRIGRHWQMRLSRDGKRRYRSRTACWGFGMFPTDGPKALEALIEQAGDRIRLHHSLGRSVADSAQMVGADKALVALARRRLGLAPTPQPMRGEPL